MQEENHTLNAEHGLVQRIVGLSISLRAWRWAMFIVQTRAFGRQAGEDPSDNDGSVLLVPLADMMNHRAGLSDVTWRIREHMKGYASKLFVLRASRVIPAQGAVQHNYGVTKGNAGVSFPQQGRYHSCRIVVELRIRCPS